MKKWKMYLELYVTFFKIGLVTFGGGIAMLPILERELVNKKKWITSEEILDYFAIGQTTPGIIAVNTATFVGYKHAKNLGGIIATLGVISPSLIIITLLAALVDSIEQITWAKKALQGINVAVAANLTYAFINFAKKSVKNIAGVIILIVCFSLIYFLHAPAGIIIPCAALIGIAQYFITKHKQKKSAASDNKEDIQ